LYCALLSSNPKQVAGNAYIIKINMNAKTVEVLVYAIIRDEEVGAKTVEVVRYASTRGEEIHAKIAGVVVVYASIRD
jgi:hypothetical protein